MIVFPELAISGYGMEDGFFYPTLLRRAWEILLSIASQTPKHMLVVIGLPIAFKAQRYNAMAVIANGVVKGLRLKTTLAKEGVYYEPRWFEPWKMDSALETIYEGISLTIGDFLLSFKGRLVGIEICEEAWLSSPRLATGNTPPLDLVINSSASHFAFGKYQQRKSLVLKRAQALQCKYGYANALGLDSGRMIFDGGCMFAGPLGLEQLQGRFQWDDFVCLNGEIPARTSKPQDANTWTGTILPCDLTFAQPSPMNPEDMVVLQPLQKKVNDREVVAGALSNAPEMCENEEFLWVQILGLWDYLRKSKARGYTVALSGGCDSAVCASLVSFMTQWLARQKLDPCLQKMKEAGGETQMLRRQLLQCAYLGTEYNSEASLNAAKDLAQELNAEFHQIAIQDVFENLKQKANDTMKVYLNFSDHSLALQNLQARTRSPMIWLLANLRNHVLLATSNRSEIAAGYMTMDGDTAGGLGPIAGVPKAFLRKWIEWAASTDVPAPFHPIESLRAIAKLEPSAELRPGRQRDEEDLMPYEVLATLEEAFLQKRLWGPELEQLALQTWSPTYPSETIALWVQDFLQRLQSQQWKREKLAASFHIDQGSFDPRSFLRLPPFFHFS